MFDVFLVGGGQTECLHNSAIPSLLLGKRSLCPFGIAELSLVAYNIDRQY